MMSVVLSMPETFQIGVLFLKKYGKTGKKVIFSNFIAQRYLQLHDRAHIDI